MKNKREIYEKVNDSGRCEKKGCRNTTDWFLTILKPNEQVLKGFVCLKCCMNRGK